MPSEIESFPAKMYYYSCHQSVCPTNVIFSFSIGYKKSYVHEKRYYINTNFIRKCISRRGCTYSEADELCKQTHGTLAVIENEHYNRYKMHYLKKIKATGGTYLMYWIGLTDKVGTELIFKYKIVVFND